MKTRRSGAGTASTMATALGWLSIGLGMTELLAPRLVVGAIGVRSGVRLTQGAGLREIATGIGIVRSDNTALWVWGRVGGDVIDLVTLSLALANPRTRRLTASLAMAALAGITAADFLCARTLTVNQRRRPADLVRRLTHDYSSRSGLPRPADEMRGKAREVLERLKAHIDPTQGFAHS